MPLPSSKKFLSLFMGYFSHCQGEALALWGSKEAHHRRVCEAEVSGVWGLFLALKCSECAGLVQKVLNQSFYYTSFRGSMGILCPRTESCPQFPWVDSSRTGQDQREGPCFGVCSEQGDWRMAPLFTTHPTGTWVYSSQVARYFGFPVTSYPIHAFSKVSSDCLAYVQREMTQNQRPIPWTVLGSESGEGKS